LTGVPRTVEDGPFILGFSALRLEPEREVSGPRVSLPLPSGSAVVVVEDRPGQVFGVEVDGRAVARALGEGAAAGTGK
jgi:hypothetical protein